jgi:hypothetical protein
VGLGSVKALVHNLQCRAWLWWDPCSRHGVWRQPTGCSSQRLAVGSDRQCLGHSAGAFNTFLRGCVVDLWPHPMGRNAGGAPTQMGNRAVDRTKGSKEKLTEKETKGRWEGMTSLANCWAWGRGCTGACTDYGHVQCMQGKVAVAPSCLRYARERHEGSR